MRRSLTSTMISGETEEMTDSKRVFWEGAELGFHLGETYSEVGGPKRWQFYAVMAGGGAAEGFGTARVGSSLVASCSVGCSMFMPSGVTIMVVTHRSRSFNEASVLNVELLTKCSFEYEKKWLTTTRILRKVR